MTAFRDSASDCWLFAYCQSDGWRSHSNSQMVLFFAWEKVIKSYLAITMHSLQHSSLMLISGITALIFAGVILFTWTQIAHWMLGLFLGQNMILMGSSLVKITFHCKSGH